LAAKGNTLVVEHERDIEGESVDGFDMDSGKRLWSTGPSNDVRYDLVQGAVGTLSAVKYDNGTFDPEDARPFSLVTFDPQTGEEDEQQDFEGFGEALGVYNTPYLDKGRLFLASVSNKGSVGSLEDISGTDSAQKSSLIVLEP
jgi:hypothetical protein